MKNSHSTQETLETTIIKNKCLLRNGQEDLVTNLVRDENYIISFVAY